MIPKRYASIWLGPKALPKIAQRCVSSWRLYLDGYDWDGKHYDAFSLPADPLLHNLMKREKYCLASNYLRLLDLYLNGGIYLDLDMELVRELPDELMELSCFVGAESPEWANTAIIGAEKHSYLVERLLKETKRLLETGDLDDPEMPVLSGPRLLTKVLREFGWESGSADFARWAGNGTVAVFTPEVFYPYDPNTKETGMTERTVGVHHFSKSWEGE